MSVFGSEVRLEKRLETIFFLQISCVQRIFIMSFLAAVEVCFTPACRVVKRDITIYLCIIQ